jgi:hypothetical protein
MSRRRNSWATRNSRHLAARPGIGIAEKTPIVEHHPQDDHLTQLVIHLGGENQERVAEPAETFGLESGRVALGRHEVELGREPRRRLGRTIALVNLLRHGRPPREVSAEADIVLHLLRTRLRRGPRE